MKKFFLVFVMALVACSDFNKEPQSTSRPGPGPSGGDDPFMGGIPDPNQGEFSREKMILNLGLNIVWPNVQDFSFTVVNMSRQVNRYCKAIGTASMSDAQTQAQNSWKEAMLAWHRIKGAEFGPVQKQNGLPSLEIYSWPLVNVCGVDNLVLDIKNTGNPVRRLNYTSQGLAALEYLLFEDKLAVQCNANVYPQTAEWAKLPEDEKRADRCRTAEWLIQKLSQRVDELSNDWNPQKKNFTKGLSQGRLSAEYKEFNVSNQRDAVNLISDSIFFIEKVKDRKLAEPLGLTSACGGSSCPQNVEHPWSDLGLKAVEANMHGLAQIITGQWEPFSGSGSSVAFGFDDFLETVGRKDLSDRILRDLQTALNRARTVSAQGGFAQQIREQTSCGSLCSLHEDVRNVARLFKTELLTALDLRPPRTIEGDND